ncbi:MAG: spore germination protein GerW family protein, partial [Eubacteriales bacterium]
TIIGKPIETNAGTPIIPVSKVSVGIASGGVDYESKKTAGNNNFGGGGGTGMQVTPVAFLVVHADGSVEMMNVSNPVSKPADIGYNISSIVDRAPEIIEKIKAIFSKKKKEEAGESGAEEKQTSASEQKDDDADEEKEIEFLDTEL